MIVLLLILVLIYHPALFWLMWGAMKWPNFRDNHESPKTGFTVLVPFRNEAQHLPQLLRSFEQLNYPWNLMEFLLIDDESTDDSVAIIRQFERSLSATQGLRIRVLQNKRKSNSPKKDAITIGGGKLLPSIGSYAPMPIAGCRPTGYGGTTNVFSKKNQK